MQAACAIMQNELISDRSELLNLLSVAACEIVRELAKSWHYSQDYLSLAARMLIWDCEFPKFWQGLFPKHNNIGADVLAVIAGKIANLRSVTNHIISVNDTIIIISAMVRYAIFCERTLFQIALKEQVITENCIICLNIKERFNGRKRKRSAFD